MYYYLKKRCFVIKTFNNKDNKIRFKKENLIRNLKISNTKIDNSFYDNFLSNNKEKIRLNLFY